jgi:sucrose-6-phosphate hydrolase SacC (GH32 family)
MRQLLGIAGLWLATGGIGALAAGESPYVAAYPKLPAIHDKTLVAWVTVAGTDQRGGSVLTIESRDSFDGIVFGEIKPRAWMAGSENFHRTETDQSAYPEETAPPGEPIRMAAVYQGRTISLYRNDTAIARYATAGDPLPLGSGANVLIGLRHRARLNQRNSYFAGEVAEARIYDRALTAGEIHALAIRNAAGPKPIGRWSFEHGGTRDLEGNFPPGALYGGAKIEHGRLKLNGKDACMITPSGNRWRSAFHYRPETGNFADAIPFFWKGVYHVFYLQGDVGLVPWRHISSRDLVHWSERPVALKPDGAPDGPDGGHMFTGSVTERDGTFHIFYTGHNDGNPRGQEEIRHATSHDLDHWTKDPDFSLRPDGIHYSALHNVNWRDPYVFYNPVAKKWWMLVIATDPKDPTEPGRPVQGLLVSDDLKTWEQRSAIPGGRGEECPDLFTIGDEWFLTGAGRYVSSSSCDGPYREPQHSVIDYPGIYAGKRMFDGKRHIWVGWAWDGAAPTDAAVAGEGVLTWGGFMCLPRELYAGPKGELLCRPAGEIVAQFTKTASEAPAGENRSLPCPNAGMILATIQLNGASEITIAVHEQPDGRAYRLTIRPSKGEIALATPSSEWVRHGCHVAPDKPVTLRLFLDGSMLECFVNDSYAITRRIFDLSDGQVSITGSNGSPKVEALCARILPR